MFGLIAPYTNFITQFLGAQVVLAPLLLLFVEESGIPLLVPGDVILTYVGYNVSTTPHASLITATIVALIAVTLGSTILFFASRRWGNTIVKKVGKFLFIDQDDITKAEHLFKRYGMWTILIGRHIPGMRIPLTIFAGISGMSYRTFISATLASTVLWIALFLNVGHRYGKDFARIIHHSVTTSILIAISFLVVILAMHFWGRWRKARKKH